MPPSRVSALLLLLLAPASRADPLVYSNDFEAKPGTTFPEWTSSRIAFESRLQSPGSGTREAAPPAVVEWPKGRRRRFLGEFGGPRIDPTARTRVRQTVLLKLKGLAPHSKATVSFDLLVLRSWDGDSPAYGPDRFRLALAGGPTLLDATFSNNPKVDSDQSLQSYPKPGSPPRTGAASTGTLDDGFFRDGIYRLTFTFAHSADSLVLEFSSDLFEGKGIEDEAWGLDDVTVRTVARSTKPKPRSTASGGGSLEPDPATRRLVTIASSRAIMERGGRPRGTTPRWRISKRRDDHARRRETGGWMRWPSWSTRPIPPNFGTKFSATSASTPPTAGGSGLEPTRHPRRRAGRPGRQGPWSARSRSMSRLDQGAPGHRLDRRGPGDRPL